MPQLAVSASCEKGCTLMNKRSFSLVQGANVYESLIIKTKLALPELPEHLVARQRLRSMLEDGIGKKLLLVQAPAGYGKTIAVADWLAERGSAYAWLSIDQSDNEFRRFFAHFIAALEGIVPGSLERSRLILQSDQPAALEAALSILVEELANCSENVVMVLDDCHLINDRTVREGLSFFLEHIPVNVHIIIISRNEPSLPLARMRARDQVTELGFRHLAFEADEIGDYYRQRGIVLSPAVVAELEKRTEGWAVGLQMAYLCWNDSGQVESWLEGITSQNQYLDSYFSEEVIECWPEDIREFLESTSLLISLNGPLCDAIMERKDSQSILQSLAEANAFLQPMDKVRRSYRYHPLMAEYLRKSLEMNPSVDKNELLIRSAAWYQKNGLVREAIRHFLEAGDYSAALPQIKDQAPFMLNSQDMNLLNSWITSLPEAMVYGSTVLCMAMAWKYFLNMDIDQGQKWLALAEKAIEQEDSSDWNNGRKDLLRGEMSLTRLFMAVSNLDLDSMREHTMEARRLIPGKSLFHKEIPDFHLHEASLLNNMLAFKGRLELCAKVFQAQTYASIRELCIGTGVLAIIKAEVCYELGDFEGALCAARDGISEAEPHGYMVALIPGIITLSKVYRGRGDWNAARSFLEQWPEKTRDLRHPQWMALLNACRTRLALETGDLETVEWWMKSGRVSIFDHVSVPSEYEHLTLVRVLIARADWESSLMLLNALQKMAETENRISSIMEILILKTLAYQGNGDNRQAMSTLHSALVLGSAHEYYRRFADEGAPMSALLRQYSRWLPQDRSEQGSPISYQYIRKLKELCAEMAAVYPQPQPASYRMQQPAAAGAYEELTVRELEVIRLLAAGHSNAHIAGHLGLALATVKFHTKNIFGKLMVSNRIQAVQRARELGLLN